MNVRQLHAALDQLLAAYLEVHPRKVPSNTTALELLEWSARRCAAQPFIVELMSGKTRRPGRN